MAIETLLEKCERLGLSQSTLNDMGGEIEWLRQVANRRGDELKQAILERDRLRQEKAEKWYKKGRESVLRDNRSGCVCKFDENDKIVELCKAHGDFLHQQNAELVETLDHIANPLKYLQQGLPEDYRIEGHTTTSLLNSVEFYRDIARAALANQPQPCGHPRSTIVSSDEETSYCGECEREARE